MSQGPAGTVNLPPWAQVTDDRRAHIDRVAVLACTWADAMGVDNGERARWLRAIGMHDALKDAPGALLAELVPEFWGVPDLRHGPAAAALAEQSGETDRGVLEAVRYHSVGYAAWDSVGRILYLADYLEPGRSFLDHRQRELGSRVPRDTEGVLRIVAAERLCGIVAASLPLLREATEFWNALVHAS